MMLKHYTNAVALLGTLFVSILLELVLWRATITTSVMGKEHNQVTSTLRKTFAISLTKKLLVEKKNNAYAHGAFN